MSFTFNAFAICTATVILGLHLPCSISHMVLCAIPHASARSFWLMPNCSRRSLMFKFIPPFVVFTYMILRYNRTVNNYFTFLTYFISTYHLICLFHPLYLLDTPCFAPVFCQKFSQERLSQKLTHQSLL